MTLYEAYCLCSEFLLINTLLFRDKKHLNAPYLHRLSFIYYFLFLGRRVRMPSVFYPYSIPIPSLFHLYSIRISSLFHPYSIRISSLYSFLHVLYLYFIPIPSIFLFYSYFIPSPTNTKTAQADHLVLDRLSVVS